MPVPLTLPLHDRRQKMASRLEACQQALAVFLLLLAIRSRLASPSPADRVMAVAQGAAGLLLLVAIARELSGRESKHVGWTNLLAGILLGLEWTDRITHGGKLVSPTLLTALVSLWLGLFQSRIHVWRSERRRVLIDGDGLDYRFLYRRFRAAWTEVEAMESGSRALHLHTRAGKRHTIPLGRLENGAEIAEAVLARARDAGVGVRSSRLPR